MTMSSITEVDCPDCGHRQEIEIYQTLNVSLNSGLKERLISGDLITFDCQKCGDKTYFPFPLLYHDMDKKILVYWLQDEDDTGVMNSPEDPLVEMGLKRYRKRVVFSFYDLLEKIAIFDTGLNDKTIEFLKLNIKDKHLQIHGDHIELLFDGCNENKENDRIISFVILNKNFEYTGKVFEIEFSLYTRAHDVLQDYPKIMEEDGNWMNVDQALMLPVYKENLRFDNE